VQPEVELIDVSPSVLASVTARVPRASLTATIPKLLDPVWAFIRTPPAKQFGSNVLIYHAAGPREVLLEAGVEVSEQFEPTAEISCSRTPSGPAAHVVHMGPYSQLGRAHDALIAYSGAHGLGPGVHWEVYGDWFEDESQLRTDVDRQIPS
jgi:effector-binding domain-containing protein